ncbi:MAG: hypothetical protein E5W56_00785 [Mesorhizobium sp.]|nr:hypothetical protein EN874_001670 [Mesorhizobium sp. M1D.F.Ca.ET.231.01.1.1]TGP38369.1 hypothetical protein EN877_01670 [Mesorhizobium sp. M1D.F.Ca.ET.234.01.1.1]TGS50579.1 hypothetical protein EN827_01670 [Mesorhizobium sp. M1D.F.Ca.ET.184.01.1.1]TGS66464.1 hypothetical protein EN826_001670 [Mesorhizobium sp. M1D.F.Ca.ET.183.01.1.1]TIT79863.1 MAG: hypothetical protein E5W57_05270 [Mesorhizobium sp.]
MANELAIKSPSLEPNAARYDNDCQDALASHLDDLLDRAEAAGWERRRAASALMYLAAKRLDGAERRST